MAYSVNSNLNYSSSVYSKTDLQSAIQQNRLEIATEAFRNTTLWKDPLPNGHSPLVYAIRLGRFKIVKELTQHYPINYSENDFLGLNPIDHAVIGGDPKMIALLIGSAMGKAFDEAGVNSEHSLANIRFQEIESEIKLRKTPDLVDASSLQRAAFTGDLAKMRECEASEIHQSDPNGLTALHYASLGGQDLAVEWLLKQGAAVDPLAKDKKSPLHLAVIGGFPKLIERLIAAKHPVHLADAQGRTPLHYAAASQNLGSISLLVKSGAQPLDRNLDASPLDILMYGIRRQASLKDGLKIDSSTCLLIGCVFGSWVARFAGQEDLAEIMDTAVQWTAFGSFAAHSESWAEPIAFAIRCILLDRFIFVGQGFEIFKVGTSILAASQAFKGIGTSLKHRHLETWRPLRNSLIQLFIGADSISRFYDYLATGPNSASKPPRNQGMCSKLNSKWPNPCNVNEPKCIEETGVCMGLVTDQCDQVPYARKILGVTESSSEKEYTKNYRQGMLLFHPDKFCKGKTGDPICKEDSNKIFLPMQSSKELLDQLSKSNLIC